MQEFTQNTTVSFDNGLAPNARMRIGQRSLIEARGVQAGTFGLEPFEPPAAIAGAVIDWPFPQLLSLQDEYLWMTAAGISRLTPGTWVRTVLPVNSPATGLPIVPVIGGRWHVADLPGSFFLFNGNTTIFKTGLHRMIGEAESIYGYTAAPIRTGCAHRGRVLIGGFTEALFAGSVLAEAITAWKAEGAGEAAFADIQSNVEENVVLWGSIGGGDFPTWLMFPAEVVPDLVPTIDDLILRLKQNTWGFMPMPWKGVVMNMRPLGDSVIVYGDEGIAALVLANGTYGLQKIAGFGISDRDAVVGEEDTAHHFISSDGVLWRLNQDRTLTRLGYESYASGLLGDTPVLLHTPYDGRIFLGDGEELFVLAQRGDGWRLTEGNYIVTSVLPYHGVLYGIRQPYEDTTPLLVTSPFDLGIRGHKTINSITFAHQSAAIIQVALDYRYSAAETWQRTPFAGLNKEGVAYIRVSAPEFRLVVKASNFATMYLDDIQFKFQINDKRNLRGPLQQTAAGDL